MISLADLVEELQQENENVNILDEDIYNGKPALVSDEPNYIIGITTNEDHITVHYEDYDNGRTFHAYLVNEDNIPDFYDELASFIMWVIETKSSPMASSELLKILNQLEEQGYEPVIGWQPELL